MLGKIDKTPQLNMSQVPLKQFIKEDHELVFYRERQKEKYEELLLIFNQILSQQRDSKDKIYRIHEPHVKCIGKGKEAKKYEYGNKVSIAKTRKSGIIVGALSFLDNVYDGATLQPQLDQIEKITGHKPKTGIVDRGYRGRKWVNET